MKSKLNRARNFLGLTASYWGKAGVIYTTDSITLNFSMYTMIENGAITKM